MKCINCGSEWNATGKAATTIVNCPFCGESPVVKKGASSACETSKEALMAIYKKFGSDVLLGKLNAYIADFAPSLSTANKRLVNSVYEFWASKALKENLNGSQEDKERAVKIAVRAMTEAFVKDEVAEEIIHEFTEALGWKIEKSAEHPEEKTQTTKEKGSINNIEQATLILEDAEGKYSQKDIDEAFNYIKKLAEQDDAEAQIIIGWQYLREGMCGSDKDAEEGAKWFKKAEKNGHKKAAMLLKRYEAYIPVNGKLTLPVGIWEGGILNGKPCGVGKIIKNDGQVATFEVYNSNWVILNDFK